MCGPWLNFVLLCDNLFPYFLCHPYIWTIFVENIYGSLFTVASYVAVCLLYVAASLLYVDQYGSNEVGASQLEVAQFLNTSLKTVCKFCRHFDQIVLVFLRPEHPSWNVNNTYTPFFNMHGKGSLLCEV